MNANNLAHRLQEFPTATIYEAAGKSGDMDPAIRAIVPGIRMAGPAFTVRCFVGDARAVVQAIALAQAGDVLVVDGGGTDRATPWGSTSALAAKVRGLAGCVTNGAVRDLEELIEIGLPVFASGVSVRGNVKLHPGWIGMPVSVGGVVVRPNDIVVGDADGVVVIPGERGEEVYARAREQRAKEKEIERQILAGEPLTRILDIS
ncbi:MAG: 4-hydroxy-4-methyl-2-oxoglutarate aldolase [Proteobacteria bacterium]|nr:4-hydroxy-4-methyl-2-oxoglutarate aldolase [Pseudomonadota bacterium]